MAPGDHELRRERTAMDMLTRSHHKLHQRLYELAQVLHAPGPDTQETVENVIAFLRGPLANHIADEEQSAFPRVSAGNAPLVEQLVAEHRDNERLLGEFERAWKAGDTACAAQLATDLERAWTVHSKLEEDALWPALSQLPPEVASDMRTEMRQRRGK